jgi:hypothetical protein
MAKYVYRSQFFPKQSILPHAAMIIAADTADDSIGISAAGAGGGPAARGRKITAGIAISTAAHRTSAIAMWEGAAEGACIRPPQPHAAPATRHAGPLAEQAVKRGQMSICKLSIFTFGQIQSRAKCARS